MTETAKERFYREELESIKLDLLEARPVSPSNIAKALIEADELPVTTDKLSVEKLQEQLNTAKKALTEIAYGEYNTFKLSAVPIAKQALAAIGCGGCPVGAVGKNGLTKEEIEGSGDE